MANQANEMIPFDQKLLELLKASESFSEYKSIVSYTTNRLETKGSVGLVIDGRQPVGLVLNRR